MVRQTPLIALPPLRFPGSHYTGSTFGPVRKSILYNVNSVWGNRTGLELSCSHHIGSIFVLVWQKQTYLRVQESDNEIPFQKRGRSAEQLIHIRSGAFQKAIRYGTYHFWNRSVPARNRHRNCAGPAGSNVNRRPIRYGFRGAPIIDPVQCEHGLKIMLVIDRSHPGSSKVHSLGSGRVFYSI